MENPKKLKELIKKLIYKSKTKKALEKIEKEISKPLEDSDLENSITVLLAELNHAENERRSGIISYADYRAIVAKINIATLEIVDEINLNNNMDYIDKYYETNPNVPFRTKVGNKTKVVKMSN